MTTTFYSSARKICHMSQRSLKYLFRRHSRVVAALAIFVLIVGCGRKEMPLQGVVTIDGKPLDAGTIQFQAKDGSPNGAPASTGSAVQAGKFQIAGKHGLQPGTYRVNVVGFRLSGRKVHDPQRGDVEERVPLNLGDAPIEVTISPDNTRSLEIALKSAR
jgi:hypothetical protein